MSIEIDTKTAVPPKATRLRASKHDRLFEQVQPGIWELFNIKTSGLAHY